MKRWFAMAGMFLLMAGSAAAGSDTVVSDLSLKGKIEGENIVFNLEFEVAISAKTALLPLVVGDVAYLESDLPKGSELIRNGNKYNLKLTGGGWRGGRQKVRFSFASRALKEGEWRHTHFQVPAASIRKISVVCDRNDLEVRFPGALNIERKKTDAAKTEVTAYLGITDQFQVRWKPEVKKLNSELVVSCEANTIATASVGAMRLDTVFTYRVIQGTLEKLSIALPNVSVTQVTGDDIQGWRIDRSDPDNPHLVVALSRFKEDIYRLQVESEITLPKFPAQSSLPVLVPLNVIRTSGFLQVGTDSAIKLQVSKAAGLTQIDPAAFPNAVTGINGRRRKMPARGMYAYQFANTPYTLDINADDIVSTFTVDNRLVLSLSDNELAFDASVEVNIKDAPAREIIIETDADTQWTVTSISGQHISEADTDVRDEPGRRIIYVPFKQAISGTALISIRMERSLERNATEFSAPRFTVADAKSERGYLVVSAEKGVRLKTNSTEGLREVHTGSAKMRVPGAQQAFRFKTGSWRLLMDVERTRPSIDSELFHLVSLGEGVMYCSAAITYHISGAPVQEFRVKVPETIETVEFTGADIEGWQRSGDICTVRLQAKVIGDYTLLVTFDRQFDYDGAVIDVGNIETVETDSEVGYIAMASSASLELIEAESLPGSIIRIDRDEIPSAYSSPVNAPIIKSYKYVKNPHTVSVRIQPLETEPMLEQIADYVKLETRLSKKGGAVTTGTYYIKNASRQYLTLQLPDGVDLWTIKYVYENGTKENVPSQDNGNQILIPVNRPQNPNTAIAIEIVYAQTLGEFGFWHSGFKGIRLDAPTLPGTHATFASWLVKAPDGLSIVSKGGNMNSKSPISASGLAGVAAKTVRILKAACYGHYTLGRALSGGYGGGESQEFIRSVNLAGERPLNLRLSLVPVWMGANSSARLMVGALLAGIIILAAGLFVLKSRAAVALGLSAIVFGTAECAAGRSLLAVCVWLLFVGLAFRYGIKPCIKIAVWSFKLGWTILSKTAGMLLKVLSTLWTGWSSSRNRSHARKIELQMAAHGSYDIPPFENKEQDGSSTAPPNDKGGFVTMRGLLAPVLLTAFVISATAASTAQNRKPSQQKRACRIQAAPAADAPLASLNTPVMDLITLEISGPQTARDAEKSALVKMILDFSADSPLSFIAIPNSCVLTDYKLNSRQAEINSSPSGYILNVLRKGRQRITLNFRLPVIDNNGNRSIVIPMLANMRNKIRLTLPESGMDIRAEKAVLFRSKSTENSTTAEAVFGPVSEAEISWHPRIRKTTLEETVFFSEVNTFATLLAGVVDLTHLVRYQIAQGEIKELKLSIPEGMSVTSVKAAGLATWRFDPDTHLLEAILKKSVSGDFLLTVQTQMSSDGLPYSADLGAPDIRGSSRQRGSLAIAAPGTVQVRIDSSDTVNPMNIEDFSTAAVKAAISSTAKRSHITIRRAFRYDRPAEVSITTHAEQVLPEIRVTEQAALDVADERIVLSSRISLSIAKAGIFSIRIGIPADYDVETLTGRDVSHWDEIAAGGTSDIGGGSGITVYFKRYVADSTEINLVVAKTEKGIDERISVPRVYVADSRKHSGRLTISGERGVRMMVENQHGVDIRKASEVDIRRSGVLVFDLLRPTWAINLKTEVMAPLVKPEVLQVVDLTEGMLKCKAFVNYKIENAGVKSFRLQSPLPGVSLAVTGPNIAGVNEYDKEKGLWQIDLHSKVENKYSMTVGFQVPFNHEEHHVKILPLKTVDTEGQRGYLAVTCGGRVQVVPDDNLEGLKSEDSRSVPKKFKAGDLSDAILCYRTLRPDYELPLSVVRHDSAAVLPASISKVRLTSIISGNRKLLTRLVMELSVGDLRFLRMTLPRKGDSIWTVLVNGREVSTSRDGELYCIPLEEQEGQEISTVEIIYAGSVGGRKLLREHKITAPSFAELPLNDIKWSFFVLPHEKYYGFGGTMEIMPENERMKVFNADGYIEWNKQQRAATALKARQVLNVGEQMAKAGRQKEAKKAFQQALNYSLGKADLSEDARVQLRNVTKQQFKMGLVNRRGAVRYRNNIIDEQTTQQMDGFNGGDFTQVYARNIEQQLSANDNDALDIVAEKMIDQQAAAAGVVKAIRIAMPEHGRELKFQRALQVDPESKLTVTFKVSRAVPSKLAGTILPIIILFLGLWGLLSLGRKPVKV